jgi:stearoyl-CoA desaturase (delta-9 desaturase)
VPDAWLVVLIAVALTQLAVIATSIYLHRGLTHCTLVVHPAAEVVFRTFLWLTTGLRRREWVAVHRKHHTFTDREGDPHSPRLLGLWRVQLLNVYYYAREAKNPETLRKFAPDIKDDRLDRLFSSGWLGLGVGTLLLCAALGLVGGIAAMLLHGLLYVFVLAPLINGLSHWRGRQNFASNTAYNWRVLAWVTGGESLHNNHHADPRAPKFSMRPWEWDPSWVLIRAMVAVRLIVLGSGQNPLI